MTDRYREAAQGGGATALTDTPEVDTPHGSPTDSRSTSRRADRESRRETRRHRQRSRRSVRLRRLAVTGVTAGLVLGAGAAWLAYASPFFDIREVEVVGAPGYLADPIEQAAGVTLGGPLISVDLGVIEDRVSQLIDVQNVTAQQRWPHTVVVNVTPRITVGVAPAAAGGVELVGSDGAAMGTIEAAPEGLPLVKGAGDDRRRVALALATLDPAALAAVAWGQVRDGDVELLLREDRGFVLWGGDEDGATKGKALGVLLAYDEDARWFDLTRAGTPTTLLSPPPDARKPEASASASPSATGAPVPQDGVLPEVAATSTAPEPQPVGSGGEQPAGLVPQGG